MIDANTLYLAPQAGMISAVCVRSIVRRLRTIIEAVETRGHSVRILGTESSAPMLGRSIEVVKRLEQESPGKVCWVQSRSERDAYHVLWPRDALCDWDTFIAVADAPGLHAFAATLDRPLRLGSPLCEGGIFVRAGHCVLVSDVCSPSVELPRALLSFRISHPYRSDRYRRHQPEHEPLTHLDLDLALIPHSGATMLLVGERYNRAYPEEVALAAEQFQAELVEVGQREVDRRGLNLVVLSERAVLLPSGCPQVRGQLAEVLGPESVLELPVDDTFNYNGGRGGLRCMSAVVRVG
jgi:hypothetical protein